MGNMEMLWRVSLAFTPGPKQYAIVMPLFANTTNNVNYSLSSCRRLFEVLMCVRSAVRHILIQAE